MSKDDDHDDSLGEKMDSESDSNDSNTDESDSSENTASENIELTERQSTMLLSPSGSLRQQLR